MIPTGRIKQAPAELLDQEVLGRRFEWEMRHLLRHYQWIELAHLDEYLRMELLDHDTAAAIRRRLLDLTADRVTAERSSAMSDALFALERCVHNGLTEKAGAWHVDRSRNDVQACAQLMLGRERLLGVAAAVTGLARAARKVAARHDRSVMPGYTQHQTAQAITFGFYLAALAESATASAESLHALYDSINLSPLGAGAFAGLELPWDRARLADALGFSGPQPHALTAVASRAWASRIAAELSVLGTTLSRFLTDLIWWSGSSCRFLDLPDELAGISSVMPHKRNFPVLERARGMSGHLVGLSVDLMVGQRNTGYTNLVEVSKESTRFLEDLFSLCGTMLALTEQVVRRLRFQRERAARAVRGDLLAASTVANRLTLEHGIPARTAQVVVGAWILAATQELGPGDDLTPGLLTADGLAKAAADQGHPLSVTEVWLRTLLDAEASVARRRTSGSTRPEEVHRLLEGVDLRLAAVARRAGAQSVRLSSAWQRTSGQKAGDAA